MIGNKANLRLLAPHRSGESICRTRPVRLNSWPCCGGIGFPRLPLTPPADDRVDRALPRPGNCLPEPITMTPAPNSSSSRLLAAAAAAFCTYFCMYAFRKPFTAGTFEGQSVFGFDFKAVLVIAQLLGYMLSKFIGIKVISEMRSERRAAAILGLIFTAEAALVGFAFARRR